MNSNLKTIELLLCLTRQELKEENFPHLRGDGQVHSQLQQMDSTGEADQPSKDPTDIEAGSQHSHTLPPPNNLEKSEELSVASMDEDQLFIEVPVPGFQLASSSSVVAQMKNRLAPNVCSICLCNYDVGNQVVWSSNQACEHVFHEQCILQWIMKQREGPMCPCCRRDFVLDPYDMEDDEIDPAAVSLSVPPEAASGNESMDSSEEEEEDGNGGSSDPNHRNLLAERVAAAQASEMAMHMEEGLSSSES